jgi:hypothetical protein
MREKLNVAWLIQWDGQGDHARKKSYVDVVSARKSAADVRDYVQRLYNLNCLSMQERMQEETFKKADRRIPATVTQTSTGSDVIHCGHNPWLEARKVRNLIVETDENGAIQSINYRDY